MMNPDDIRREDETGGEEPGWVWPDAAPETEQVPTFSEPEPIYPQEIENAVPTVDDLPQIISSPEPSDSESEPTYSELVEEMVDDVEQPQLWAEPVVESAVDEPSEVYSPAMSTPGKTVTAEKPVKEKKKSHWFLKAVCLLLVCVLASGTATYFLVDYLVDARVKEAIEESMPTNQVIIGSTGGTGTGSNDPVITPTGSMSGSALYEMACKQVVGINTSVTTNAFGQPTTQAVSGSGFIISGDGYILTNYHVVSYAVLYQGSVTVMFHDGTSYPATVVGYVEDNDVAVIKIDPTNLTLNPVSLGNSDDLRVGDKVYAIGNPLGELLYTMTDGIVSALDRIITTRDDTTGLVSSMNMFQISAAVNSGNSGGPVYNDKGQVVGIVTAKYSDSGIEGLGFAIPINDAVAIAAQLIEKGYVAGASLGIECASVDDIFSTFTMEYYGYPNGTCVVSVTVGSAAEKAGLRPGDIITGLDDSAISSLEELQMVLRRYAPGDTATLTVYRLGSALGEGEYIQLKITFDEKKPDTTDSGSGNNQQTEQGGWPGDWSWGDIFGGGK